jgi:hypothetical protein
LAGEGPEGMHPAKTPDLLHPGYIINIQKKRLYFYGLLPASHKNRGMIMTGLPNEKEYL